MYGIMLTVHDEKCYECMIWIFGGMNEWENGLLTMQCIKVWKYGRMNEYRQWKSEKSNRFDMYKNKPISICDIMYY